MKEQIVSAVALILSTLMPAVQGAGDFLVPLVESREVVLWKQSLDLHTRMKSPYANEVFRYNILLALKYFDNPDLPAGRQDSPDILENSDFSFTLQPGEVFAFHGNIAPEFANLVVQTMNSRFYIEEGYKSVGGLGGNGVCHLASLMNWTASSAGLEVIAPTDHGFAPIPGVPREYWTSIRYCQHGCNSQNQNLYIKNNFDFPVKFVFRANEQKVDLRILRGD